MSEITKDKTDRHVMPALYLFRSDCGHSFIGAIEGSYTCPVCGRYDGDHHLVEYEDYPIQVNDYGCVWSKLAGMVPSEEDNLSGIRINSAGARVRDE